MERPQFTTQESNNSLLLSITKERVTELKVMPGLNMDFGWNFQMQDSLLYVMKEEFIKKVIE